MADPRLFDVCLESALFGGPEAQREAGVALLGRAIRGIIKMVEADSAINVVHCTRT